MKLAGSGKWWFVTTLGTLAISNPRSPVLLFSSTCRDVLVSVLWFRLCIDVSWRSVVEAEAPAACASRGGVGHAARQSSYPKELVSLKIIDDL